jgi:hypothetical protein
VAVEIISTVLVAATATAPAGPYDLTDLKTVYDELNLPASNTADAAFLQRAITQASQVIASYCNRVFAVEALQDQIFIQQDPYPWQVPGGVYPLQLSRWPLPDTSAISFTGNTHGTTTVDGIPSMTGLAAGQLVFAADGSMPAGAEIQSVGTNSITLTAAATSSETGLALTAGLQVVQTLSVGDTQTLVYGTDYTIDAKRGWLIRLNSWTGVSERWEAEPVTVQYRAGFATIPADLTDACLRLVTMRYKLRGRDPTLRSRGEPGVGQEQYWVGALPAQRGSLPPEIQALVDPYRVPVTA